jgi:hypothetical protein
MNKIDAERKILQEQVNYENKLLRDRVFALEERQDITLKQFDNMQTHTKQV